GRQADPGGAGRPAHHRRRHGRGRGPRGPGRHRRDRRQDAGGRPRRRRRRGRRRGAFRDRRGGRRVTQPLKIMLVAVEASADTLGAGLARALRARLGDGVTFVGVGGAKMAAEGVQSPYDIGDLSLVGLFEIAGAVPLALRRLEETVRLAEAAQPDIAVLIDSWEFTWRIARRLRLRVPAAARIKYVAPQVWATR